MDPFIIFKGFFKLFTLNFVEFINILNSISVEATWVLQLFFCFVTILFFLRFFGEAGIYVYTSIAVIAANIQVLKIVKFSFFSEPVALGTILFASTFLCTDILTEYFGARSARKNIAISFFSFLFMTILMLITIGFKPIDEITAGLEYQWAISIQDNLEVIFLPLPIFFCSSMIAYLFSQYFDVWFYEKISILTNKKFLWFRNNFSTIFSSLIDNTIFSIFAWIIFNPEPLKFNTVLFTFILGTFVLRILISIFDTPFIYLAKYFLPKKNNE